MIEGVRFRPLPTTNSALVAEEMEEKLERTLVAWGIDLEASTITASVWRAIRETVLIL